MRTAFATALAALAAATPALAAPPGGRHADPVADGAPDLTATALTQDGPSLVWDLQTATAAPTPGEAATLCLYAGRSGAAGMLCLWPGRLARGARFTSAGGAGPTRPVAAEIERRSA